MAAKKKHLYGIHCTTKLGIGLQWVKADTQKEAKDKFKKRFPKSRILDTSKSDPTDTDHSRRLNSSI